MGVLSHLDHDDLNIEAILLSPLAGLYALGWMTYEGIYRLGLKKPVEPHCPVICVGNLVVGGSGKTPMTMHIAQVLRGLGREVAISLSGYGSPRSAGASLAPEGELDAGEWGDEPALMRWLMPELPLIVGRRRVRAAEICHERFPHAVLLMDDGFQHLPLTKHISIVLDPRRANQMCLPSGPYREPRSGLKRATLALPMDERFDVYVRPLIIRDEQGVELEDMTLNPEVDLLCAIANPRRLTGELMAAGFEIVDGKYLRDHDPLTGSNIFAGLSGERPIVVTAKDWVKLRRRRDLAGLDFLIVDYQFEVTPVEAFADWLEARLDEIETQGSRGAAGSARPVSRAGDS